CDYDYKYGGSYTCTQRPLEKCCRPFGPGITADPLPDECSFFPPKPTVTLIEEPTLTFTTVVPTETKLPCEDKYDECRKQYPNPFEYGFFCYDAGYDKCDYEYKYGGSFTCTAKPLGKCCKPFGPGITADPLPDECSFFPPNKPTITLIDTTSTSTTSTVETSSTASTSSTSTEATTRSSTSTEATTTTLTLSTTSAVIPTTTASIETSSSASPISSAPVYEAATTTKGNIVVNGAMTNTPGFVAAAAVAVAAAFL
ncbi:hypothetical protein HDU96_001375, partial [Phlyctochytrium bullatum]